MVPTNDDAGAENSAGVKSQSAVSAGRRPLSNRIAQPFTSGLRMVTPNAPSAVASSWTTLWPELETL